MGQPLAHFYLRLLRAVMFGHFTEPRHEAAFLLDFQADLLDPRLIGLSATRVLDGFGLPLALIA